MTLSSDQVAIEATSFLDHAHHRQDIDTDFNKLDLREQFRITRAMKHQNDDYESQHPELPKVSIETFADGQLKELDVKGRIWGWNSCYSRDKDPGVPNPVNQGFKSIINGLKEVLDP